MICIVQPFVNRKILILLGKVKPFLRILEPFFRHVEDRALVRPLIFSALPGDSEALFSVVTEATDILTSGNVVLEPRPETLGSFLDVKPPTG